VLFSTDPDIVGLYGKPMARNSQIRTDQYRLLLDGPLASREELRRAARAIREGGRFGYRIYYPPMRVGKYEVFWHLPLVSYLDPETRKPKLLDDAPLGYLTAYDADEPDLSKPVELWPELRRRPEFIASVWGYKKAYGHHDHQIALNAFKLVNLTDVDGVMDAGRTKIFRRLSTGELERLIADGTVSGGMIPKITSSLQAVKAGVDQAHILNGNQAHNLLLELFTDAGVGTMISR
jgi:hypothetical protein